MPILIRHVSSVRREPERAQSRYMTATVESFVARLEVHGNGALISNNMMVASYTSCSSNNGPVYSLYQIIAWFNSVANKHASFPKSEFSSC
eukprot:CCRYP_018222-RA/>CCRYP_018222-RA protein AED:0.17 eAED:0.17 QI:475/0.5/1/1/0/0/3/1744/90